MELKFGVVVAEKTMHAEKDLERPCRIFHKTEPKFIDDLGLKQAFLGLFSL